MDYLISATTDIGNVKQTNQDSHSVRILNTPLGKMVFAVLCDGMGGLSKGEVASASLVNAYNKWSETILPKICENGALSVDIIQNEWTKIAVEYNEKIKVYGKKCGISLGTTLTAMLITQNEYYVINVGDTRAYEISAEITIITKDQTVVAKEIELGNITEEQAETDSRRSVLLQCIGASDTVYPDVFYGNTGINTVYMLCTDGFRHEISSDEIFNNFKPDIMTNVKDMKEREKFLIDLNKQRQERDNITVITIRTY